jgi:biotin operon repressor
VKASSNQKHAGAALAQQLEMTREKLLVLKSHLKKGKGSEVDDKRKPRLRRLLDRLDKRDKYDFEESENLGLNI